VNADPVGRAQKKEGCFFVGLVPSFLRSLFVALALLRLVECKRPARLFICFL
jgi:hypothetical protein